MGVIIITLPMKTPVRTLYPTDAVRQSGGLLVRLLCLLGLLAAGLVAAAWWWSHQPLPLKAPAVDVSIEAGSSPKEVARAWVDAGVDVSPWWLYQAFRWSGQARQIKAGGYELVAGQSAADLLRMMVRGDERLAVVRLIDGWTFARFRQELAQAEGLRPDAAGWPPERLMAELGKPGVSPEGQFFPDTYAYAKGSSDLQVMRRALQAMDKQMAAAWAARKPGTPLRTPMDALILASIVEKETGAEVDRGRIAGVFHNRLKLRMPLQTDPTVIYGLGERFDGNLRRVDLQTDTAYNTYTRTGLPPTPIAMPGKAALRAATQPDDTPALYFVARGDGTSAFSATLAEHNRAVNQYQRRKSP
ncbi:MAG: endolytic transglycosylase MltG [Pseudomonadota bacterium]|jgi:UPF0755 protein